MTLLPHPVVWAGSVVELLAVVALLPTLAAIMNHLICHEPGCYRMGKYPHEHYKLCRVHHPGVSS